MDTVSSARHSPNPLSPRLAKVLGCRAELLHIAGAVGANRVALCGSVARGHDSDTSDIDFYVWDFDATDRAGDDAWQRANRLVVNYRRILQPYHVDVRGIPGWLLGSKHEAGMKRDAIDLEKL